MSWDFLGRILLAACSRMVKYLWVVINAQPRQRRLAWQRRVVDRFKMISTFVREKSRHVKSALQGSFDFDKEPRDLIQAIRNEQAQRTEKRIAVGVGGIEARSFKQNGVRTVKRGRTKIVWQSFHVLLLTHH